MENKTNNRNQPDDSKKLIKTRIHLFRPTGGSQPVTPDPDSINHFFVGNYAKSWAMKDGFMPTFLRYDNGCIEFKIVSDPRYTGHDLLLARFIARAYKERVNVLSDAKEYHALHFKATGPIGFLVSSDTPEEKIQELMELQSKAYRELPKKPEQEHFGSLK